VVSRIYAPLIYPGAHPACGFQNTPRAATTESVDATRITEAVALPNATGSGVLLGEAVREAGLDPELYLAVLPAEVAWGGKVGENGRVYEPESLIAHHTRLSEQARESFVTGENGHPDAGPEGFDVPARFLGGEVVRESDGSVLAKSLFGILNTTSGRDTFVCWKAGMPIGTSLDGLARMTETVIDAKSRYAAANPGHMGQRVVESKLVALNRYDIVRTPSLGTHFDPPPGPVAEAFRRVIESKCLPEAPVPDAAPVTESSPAQVQGEPQENTMPEIKNVADLEREFPQLVAQVRESAKPVTDDAEIAKVREQAEVDRARLADAEKAARVTEAKLAETEKGLAAVTEALAREKTRTAVREALGDSWASGRKGAVPIRAAVLEDFEAGRIATVQEATAAADRYERIAREAAALGQAETKAPETPAPVVPVTEGRDSTLTNADKPGATQTPADPFAASFGNL